VGAGKEGLGGGKEQQEKDSGDGQDEKIVSLCWWHGCGCVGVACVSAEFGF